MPFEFQHTRGIRCSQHSPQPNFDVDKIYSLQINIDDVIFRSLQGKDWDTICRTVDIGHNWFQCPGCVRASRAWQSAVEDYCCRNHIHLTCEERQLLSYTDTPMMNVLKVGIPKGTLQESTLKFFKKAGYTINIGSRSYYPSIDDDEIEAMLLRPQDMALYVERGVIDIGLAGSDWVRECKADVLEVGALTYSKQTNRPARWVLAVAEDSPIKSVADLEGKIVFTELVEATKSYLVDNGVNATVKFSHGATEVKIPHLCDAIVEITETGSSLRANRLRIVDVVLQSVTTLVVNKESWANEWKRTKIENLYLLLSGALAAEEKVGLKMNISDENLKSVLAILPAMKKPTISSLSEDGWRAVETIIDEHIVRDLIPELKRVGAEGIIEYPLNKVIP